MKKLLLMVAVLLLTSVSVARAADLVKIGEDASVPDGASYDNVVVIFGNINVDGVVSKDIVVVGGDITVGPTGKVNGDAVVVMGKLVKAPGAEVSKDVVAMPFGRSLCAGSCIIPILGFATLSAFGVFMIIGFLALLLFIAIVFTDKVGRASFYAEKKPFMSLLYGIIVAALIAPVTTLLVISIVGIPVVPLFFILVLLAVLFGYTSMCQLIGVKFFHLIKKPGKHMLWEVVVGFVIIGLIALIPFIGWMIKAALGLIGLGATLATRCGTKQAV